MRSILVPLLILLATAVSADVVLNEKVMELSKTAAELANLAYEEDPPGDEYKDFGFYDEEPDQALVAFKDGYCYGAFRGTTLTWIDWKQNVRLGKEEICFGGDCCQTRTGFYDAYNTDYRADFEKAIRNCAEQCSSPDECVVLTGHSQGGAIAAVAALYLADLNPYIITFGQPHTIDAPCPVVSSKRWFRYVNTKESGKVGITYDPVSFVPGMGADSFGHLILLSNDNSGVAYIGLDAQDSFSPLNIGGFEAHSMVGTSRFPGYCDRIDFLMNSTDSYPIRTTGYTAGSLCSEDKECESNNCQAETHFTFNRCVGVECKKDGDCDSNRCDSGVCVPKLGTCQPCDEDSDCAGGNCLLFRCSGDNGLMDENCACRFDSDCDSGRCEGLAPPQCEARKAIGAYCDEASDCLSEYCSWRFQCSEKLQDGGFCRKDMECTSGHCSWWFRCSTPAMLMAAELERAPRSIESTPKEETTSTTMKVEQAHDASGHFASFGTVGAVALVGIGLVGGKQLLDRRYHGRAGYEHVPSVTMEV